MGSAYRLFVVRILYAHLLMNKFHSQTFNQEHMFVDIAITFASHNYGYFTLAFILPHCQFRYIFWLLTKNVDYDKCISQSMKLCVCWFNSIQWNKYLTKFTAFNKTEVHFALFLWIIPRCTSSTETYFLKVFFLIFSKVHIHEGLYCT